MRVRRRGLSFGGCDGVVEVGSDGEEGKWKGHGWMMS